MVTENATARHTSVAPARVVRIAARAVDLGAPDEVHRPDPTPCRTASRARAGRSRRPPPRGSSCGPEPSSFAATTRILRNTKLCIRYPGRYPRRVSSRSCRNGSAAHRGRAAKGRSPPALRQPVSEWSTRPGHDHLTPAQEKIRTISADASGPDGIRYGCHRHAPPTRYDRRRRSARPRPDVRSRLAR